MNSHLIAIEVCVECSTDQWVDLDRLTFDQEWFEGLDTETVESRSAVEQDWMLCDHLFQDIPDDRA